MNTNDDSAAAYSPRLDFVAFKKRMQRLIDDLIKLRPAEAEPEGLYISSAFKENEGAEINLEAEKVIVKFLIKEGPKWTVLNRLFTLFQDRFATGYAPLFCKSIEQRIIISKARKADEGYCEIYKGDNTSMQIEKMLGSGIFRIMVTTGIDAFNDHFEVFVSEAARIIFPPIEKKVKEHGSAGSWIKEHGREFEKLGCIIMEGKEHSWEDLIGLEEKKERLHNAIFLPLKREGLYQKIAARILPEKTSVLPRGVLLYGPPGCGKTWSMKIIGSEIDLPVVIFPCNAVLTKWYGESENNLSALFDLCKKAGKMILLMDELDSLARIRKDSFETTARLVSILLSEMDGIGERNDILLVGSVNDINAIDQAVLDRFDLKIEYELPNIRQLKKVFAYYARHLSESDIDEIGEKFKGWNFRTTARFSEEVVREFVSHLDITQLEAPEPPLPQKEDYLKLLERNATTAG